ncbi:MAG TPA: aldolase/citrate lyase family protein [Acidobacteriota bacterium]
MDKSGSFKDKLKMGGVCVGIAVSFKDLAVTETVAGAGLDFVWIDMEHAALSIESVQGHIIAAQLMGVTSLVRVPWNDPALIKPILDNGAGGVIVPMIRSAEEAKQAVMACRYPPEGTRSFGPIRPSNYGRGFGPELCQTANESVVTVVQIEHIDAVDNLDGILQTPGLDTIFIGPHDLSLSMGLPTQVDHPKVVKVMEKVIDKSRQRGVFVGIAVGENPEVVLKWVRKGVQWVLVGADCSLLANYLDRTVVCIRDGLRSFGKTASIVERAENTIVKS